MTENKFTLPFILLIGFILSVILISCIRNRSAITINESDEVYSIESIQVITYKNPTWNGHNMILEIPEISKDVINNSLILGYLNIGIIWYSSNGYNVSGYFKSKLSGGKYIVENYHIDGTPNLSQIITYDARIVIISTTKNAAFSGDSSSKEAILKELAKAEINIKDYNQIAEYYNLKQLSK